MSTIETLEQIVGSSIKVENLFVPGNQKAKEELRDCLPIEKDTFEELASDKKNDFQPGYDGVYPRVPMDIVYASTKKMNGKTVPTFAVYDVFSGADCERKFEYNDDSSKNSKFANIFQKVYINGLEIHFFSFVGVALLSVASIFIDAISQPTTAGLFIATAILFFTMLAHNSGKKINFVFKHKFNGVIPKNVRENIKNVKRNFHEILLVEEAYAWECDSEIVKVERNVDPLIIGVVSLGSRWDENPKKLYYLIDKFDVTPLENFIATEMSV